MTEYFTIPKHKHIYRCCWQLQNGEGKVSALCSLITTFFCHIRSDAAQHQLWHISLTLFIKITRFYIAYLDQVLALDSNPPLFVEQEPTRRQTGD